MENATAGGKKRGRSFEKETEEDRLSNEKTPPNKRHTRSQSRRRNAVPSSAPPSTRRATVRSLEREIEQIVAAEVEEENMARAGDGVALTKLAAWLK